MRSDQETVILQVSPLIVVFDVSRDSEIRPPTLAGIVDFNSGVARFDTPSTDCNSSTARPGKSEATVNRTLPDAWVGEDATASQVKRSDLTYGWA